MGLLKRNRKLPPLRRASTVDELTRQNVETISQMECAVEAGRKFRERLADGFAAVVGSWTFIIVQSILLGTWVTLNVMNLVRHWDPYPFVFLNLALSFQAAYASPILMMSQNRQARLSDRRNHLGLQINLLAEQENTEMLRLLRMLCEKNGIEIPKNSAVRVLEQTTRPGNLVSQIEECEPSRMVGQVNNLKPGTAQVRQ